MDRKIIEKLSHPLEEIRSRSLDGLKLKLKASQIHLADIVHDRKCFQALLDCLNEDNSFETQSKSIELILSMAENDAAKRTLKALQAHIQLEQYINFRHPDIETLNKVKSLIQFTQQPTSPTKPDSPSKIKTLQKIGTRSVSPHREFQSPSKRQVQITTEYEEAALSVSQLQMEDDEKLDIEEEMYRSVMQFMENLPLMYKRKVPSQSLLVKVEKFVSYLHDPEISLEEEWELFCCIMRSAPVTIVFQYGPVLTAIIGTLSLSQVQRQLQSLRYLEIIVKESLKYWRTLPIEISASLIDESQGSVGETKRQPEMFCLDSDVRSIPLMEAFHLIFIQILQMLPYLPEIEKAICILHSMLDVLSLISNTMKELLPFEFQLFRFYIDNLLTLYPHLNQDDKQIVIPLMIKLIHGLNLEDVAKLEYFKSLMYVISPEISSSYLMSKLTEYLSIVPRLELCYHLFEADKSFLDPLFTLIASKSNSDMKFNLTFPLIYLNFMIQENNSETAFELINKILSEMPKSNFDQHIYMILSSLRYDDASLLPILQKNREGDIFEWVACLFHCNMRVVQYGFQNLLRKNWVINHGLETVISHVLCKLEQENYETLPQDNEKLPFDKVILEIVEGFKVAKDVYHLLDSLLYHLADESNQTIQEYLDVVLSFLSELLNKERMLHRLSIMKVIDVYFALFKRFSSVKSKLQTESHLIAVLQHISLVDEMLNQAILSHIYQVVFTKINPLQIHSSSWRHPKDILELNEYHKAIEKLLYPIQPNLLKDSKDLIGKLSSLSHLSTQTEFIKQSFAEIKNHEEFLEWIHWIRKSCIESLDMKLFMNTIPADKFEKFLLNRPLSAQDIEVFCEICQFLTLILEKLPLTEGYKSLLIRSTKLSLVTLLAHVESSEAHPALIGLLNMLLKKCIVDKETSMKVSRSVCEFLYELGTTVVEEFLIIKGLEILKITGVHPSCSLKKLCNLLIHRENPTIKQLVAQVICAVLVNVTDYESSGAQKKVDTHEILPYLTTFEEEDLMDIVLAMYQYGDEHALEKHLGSLIQYIDMHIDSPKILGLIHGLCIQRGYQNTIKLFGGFEWLKQRILSLQNENNAEHLVLAIQNLMTCLKNDESFDESVFEWISKIYRLPLRYIPFFGDKKVPVDEHLQNAFKQYHNKNADRVRYLILHLYFEMIQNDDTFALRIFQLILSQSSIVLHGPIFMKRAFLHLLCMLMIRCSEDILRSKELHDLLNERLDEVSLILEQVIATYSSNIREFVYILQILLSLEGVNKPARLFTNQKMLHLVWSQWHTSKERIYLNCLFHLLQHEKVKLWMIEEQFIIKTICQVIHGQNQVDVVDYLNILRSLASHSEVCKISLSKMSNLIEILYLKRDVHESLETMYTLLVVSPVSRTIFWDSFKKHKRNNVYRQLIQYLIEEMVHGGMGFKLLNLCILDDHGRYLFWKEGYLSCLQTSFRQCIQQKKWDKTIYYIQFFIAFSKSFFSAVYLLKERDFLDDLLLCDARSPPSNKPFIIKLLTRLSQVPEHKSVMISHENFISCLLSWIRNHDKNTKYAALCLVYEMIKDSEKTKVILKQNGIENCLKLLLPPKPKEGQEELTPDNKLESVKDKKDMIFLTRCESLLQVF